MLTFKTQVTDVLGVKGRQTSFPLDIYSLTHRDTNTNMTLHVCIQPQSLKHLDT